MEQTTPAIARPSRWGSREQSIGEIHRRFHPGSLRRLLRHLRSRANCAAWLLVVSANKSVKRILDVIASASLLLLLSPLLLFVALLIKVSAPGPVLFWQTRVGLHGRVFRFPKFRSMIADAEQLKAALLAQNDHGDGITFKMKRDPRITWLGRIIRKTSIDELPQLFLVLRGHMSLVGPRPPVPSEVERYSLRDRRRLDAVPGLTCIWQVSGRGDIPFPEQVELDVAYIESHSLWLDLVVLLRTIPAVLFGKGAY